MWGCLLLAVGPAAQADVAVKTSAVWNGLQGLRRTLVNWLWVVPIKQAQARLAGIRAVWSAGEGSFGTAIIRQQAFPVCPETACLCGKA